MRLGINLLTLVVVAWLNVACAGRVVYFPAWTPAPLVAVTPTSAAAPTVMPATATPDPPTETPIPADPPPSTPTSMPTLMPAAAPTQIPANVSDWHGQHPYTVTLQVTSVAGITRLVQIDYLLYLPYDYGLDPQQTWPLILFLHGSGERGYDPEQVAATGLPRRLQTRSDFPFIVLSPQIPPDHWWEEQLNVLPVLLDQIQSDYAVDTQREYLTGLSMGGFGAWALAIRYPRRFAAVVPIAGGWDGGTMPRNICVLKDVPMWVFHGAQDVNVFPQQTEQMVAALQQCGGNVRFTLYPDTKHNESWTRAYADPELYEWLLQQHLP